MTEPFSHDAFNFTKVKEPEVLAKYYVDKPARFSPICTYLVHRVVRFR